MNYPNNPNTAARIRTAYGLSFRVLAFLVVVFAFALGLILGAVLSALLLPVVAALIAFAAAILVGIIAVLIYRSRRST